MIVAELYGVQTMRVNEAVKNNLDKFPKGYIIELNKKEKQEVIEIFDNPKIKYSPVLPKAFTEKGLYMLATILKSPQATQTTIAIIEAFTKMRQMVRPKTDCISTDTKKIIWKYLQNNPNLKQPKYERGLNKK